MDFRSIVHRVRTSVCLWSSCDQVDSRWKLRVGKIQTFSRASSPLLIQLVTTGALWVTEDPGLRSPAVARIYRWAVFGVCDSIGDTEVKRRHPVRCTISDSSEAPSPESTRKRNLEFCRDIIVMVVRAIHRAGFRLTASTARKTARVARQVRRPANVFKIKPPVDRKTAHRTRRVTRIAVD